MASPYDGIAPEKWSGVTAGLIKKHPLTQAEILEIAHLAWDRVWQSRVGDEAHGCPFEEIDPPATVVGAFFEKLFAKELSARYPEQWAGGKGSQKDLHNLTDDALSIEMKTSGQAGFAIYGNRSYGQKLEDETAKKKDKSGYYITANFVGKTLTLVRFGWIDATDWAPQKASSGQASGLAESVYLHKLVAISGPYQLNTPVRLLDGVGPKLSDILAAMGIVTVADLIGYKGALPKQLLKAKALAQEAYGKL